MNADLGFVDHQRAGRALIGWLDNDAVAIDAAVSECIQDDRPGATAGLLFATIQAASEVLTASVGSPEVAADILREALASLTVEAIERGEVQ